MVNCQGNWFLISGKRTRLGTRCSFPCIRYWIQTEANLVYSMRYMYFRAVA